MRGWQRITISPQATMGDAIARIDEAGLQLALVVDGDGRLLGVLSDGDIRRAVLRGCGLSTPATEIMNTSPTTAPEASSRADLLGLMRRRVLHHVPLLDAERRVVGLVTLDELAGIIERPNWVVLMAGGLGTRLRPLTETRPKPMLNVGGKPILEGIVESFAEQGFRRFFISVNYLASSICDYFADGRAWGVDITYLKEDQRLGTAGALSLLPEPPTDPIIVMNGDLVTRARFDNMLTFHLEHRAAATMAVREYELHVPYGVVRLDGALVSAIDEKPVHSFFVSAGIYALSPEAVQLIPRGELYDMPTLFEQLLQSGQRAAAYPLREYWLDVGRIEELERARQEYS